MESGYSPRVRNRNVGENVVQIFDDVGVCGEGNVFLGPGGLVPEAEWPDPKSDPLSRRERATE